MTYTTFSFWRFMPHKTCPLIVNRGEPSEARLLARGDEVHIYRYTKPFRPEGRTAAGRTPTNPKRKQTTMAKKTTAAPMKATAATKKGAMKSAPSKMPMKKGSK